MDLSLRIRSHVRNEVPDRFDLPGSEEKSSEDSGIGSSLAHINVPIGSFGVGITGRNNRSDANQTRRSVRVYSSKSFAAWKLRYVIQHFPIYSGNRGIVSECAA